MCWIPQLQAESANVSGFRELKVDSAILFITELEYEQLKASGGRATRILVATRNLKAKTCPFSAESKEEF